MHGAGGGAPRGNGNARTHGEASGEALALKREVLALARSARKAMAELG